MILFISTVDSKKATIAIFKNQRVIKKKNFIAQFKQAEKLLMQIDKLAPKISQIKGIIVITGPGSFTAIRIGVVVANTIAWSLKILVQGLKTGQYKNLDDLARKSKDILKNVKIQHFVLPYYGKEPNITKSKNKT